jgi:hypothetical protein
MARTYREIATEDMVRTVEEAMSRVIDWWGELPPPMKDAIEQFRTQLGAAIDSVEFGAAGASGRHSGLALRVRKHTERVQCSNVRGGLTSASLTSGVFLVC